MGVKGGVVPKMVRPKMVGVSVLVKGGCLWRGGAKGGRCECSG